MEIRSMCKEIVVVLQVELQFCFMFLFVIS
jgi:hypothetical protein